MRSSRSLLARLQNIEGLPNTIQNFSQWETNLFRFLRRVALRTDQTPPVELRIAGGWVRDKLLSRDTGDIDIAVRYTTGYSFASKLHAHASNCLSSPNAHDSPPVQTCAEYTPNVSGVAVIAPNPSMSRHLETATVRLDGHDLDFVQLRTETYEESVDTRVPYTVSPGTPVEDSHRRDFTINSLFYNLHSRTVEDFTGMGLQDLAAGLIRTPLPPETTLKEDPLRSLRAIRFACRLQFQLDVALEIAMTQSAVRDSLLRKVSRERIGIEVMQILESPDVVRGLEMIASYSLLEPVFLSTFDTGGEDAEVIYREGVEGVRQVIGLADESAEHLSQMDYKEFGEQGYIVLILATLAADGARASSLLRDALRREKRLVQDVTRVIRLTTRLVRLVEAWKESASSGGADENEKELWIDMAEIVREAGVKLWISVILSCAHRMNDVRVLRQLVESGICRDMCCESPMVDGRRLQSELGIQAGPVVGRATRELLRMQLWQYRYLPRDDLEKSGKAQHDLSAEYCVQVLREKKSLFEVAL